MSEPTPGRIEARVRDLFEKRLLDGQFGEAPMTLREIEAVRRSISKSLIGIYHGRIAYPVEAVTPEESDSDSALQAQASAG
jgi:membrane-associated HD superfamily phosphohydrolase